MRPIAGPTSFPAAFVVGLSGSATGPGPIETTRHAVLAAYRAAA
jgi:hypothetical protein